MNSIEEKLWNYIDGSCSQDEHDAISKLIACDEVYRMKYNELLKLNSEFAAMELDEPSMAFTYNVMETIRAEAAQKPLKATIDKRIILGIAIFFVSTILVLVVYTLLNTSWTSGNISQQLSTKVNFKLPEIKNYLTSPVINGFLFFDLVLALFLFDAWLRKKNLAKTV